MANMEALFQTERLALPFLKPPIGKNGLRSIHGMIEHLGITNAPQLLHRPCEGLPLYS